MTWVPLYPGDQDGIDLEADLGIDDFDVAYAVYVPGAAGGLQAVIWTLKTQPRQQTNAIGWDSHALYGISGRYDH
jgi:hypothetical protein